MAEVIEGSTRVGIPLATTTSFVDTGATSLVASPGAGFAIAVSNIHAIPITTTTGLNDLSWRQNGTSTGLRMWTGAFALSAGTVIIDKAFDPPWVLDANQPLVAVLSLTAASTPTVYINVAYRILRL